MSAAALRLQHLAEDALDAWALREKSLLVVDDEIVLAVRDLPTGEEFMVEVRLLPMGQGDG